MAGSVTRLNKSFSPNDYDLNIDIDSSKLVFSGTVKITGKKVGRPSSRITLHQKDLKIISASIHKLDKTGKTEIAIARINKQDSLDEIRLHTKDQIYPGNYEITIKFSGIITSQMNGIYPSYYEEAKKTKTIIATQFESHHAREAFPCIDEPDAKAVFNLTLSSEDLACVISNTPLKSSKVVKNKLTSTFEPTPIMSSYLLAFVIGDLPYSEAVTKHGVKVRTYATRDNIKLTGFALDCAVKTLDFYDDYFDIPYPLEKCDFIALPDFASGAMENWGCITFREQALLVDPKNTSLNLKQYVANVVAHELTHQWFGNLVTMRWWTDLWLNESFASWMSYLAVDHLYPDWKVWTQFINDEQVPAFHLDALENTHPIEVKVRHPDEIRTIFDSISYEKGASVINMLHNYLGADNFRDGIRLYLNKHKYSNTDTIDLWKALEEATKIDVQKFMKNWTSQPGFPIVKVKYEQNVLSLKQERFYLNPKADKQPATWQIPLLNPDLDKTKFDKAYRLITLDKIPDHKLLNRHRFGFYRTIYDDKTLLEFEKDGINKFNETDRLSLLADSFEAAKAGYYPTEKTLQLLYSYKGEDNVIVWEIIASVLGSIRAVMNDEDLREDMKPFVLRLVSKQLDRLGWDAKESDNHFDKLLRPIILGLAAGADHRGVLDKINKSFKDPKLRIDIDPDLRGVVYATIARTGNIKEYNTLLKMHNETKSPEEKITLCSALSMFKQEEIIKKSLAFIKTKDVRIQDVAYWIAYSFSSRYSRDLTWSWLKDNWNWLEDNMGNDLSFYRMPNYAARCYSDIEFLKEYESFFNKHLSISFERPLKQGIETIQWQSDWRRRDLSSVKEFFSTYLD